ncbi:hypothetical protein [Streptomyces sp. AM 2-1-1]|uniref:hypothetical protein n=1 Tax=Streptomyces sp. AM 2-1-1 TaxID=3028709 RepID=UPI0023B9E2CE|nr:hypothetical protein [Streptomyces sp. AM 2-1-1]WEH40775.1 hypothetical protein PZB77_15395 [Streptomyces sp. AM 2-1-1]
MRDRNRAAAEYVSGPDMDTVLDQARTALDTPTRELLAHIGTALRTIHPTLAMREVTRLAYAGRTAGDAHGLGTPRAAAALRLLLRHMPRVDSPVPPSPITRAEYGMRLLQTAGPAAAQYATALFRRAAAAELAEAQRRAQAERVAELHRLADADYAAARPARERFAHAALAHATDAPGARVLTARTSWEA